METNFRSKRILRDIQSFKETFPNNNITHKDLKIVITATNLKCIIKLPSDYPFNPPLVLVNYDGCTFYQSKIVNWITVMDIRTVFDDVLNTINDGSYKNFERIQNKINLSDHIDTLKIKYPNIKVTYCEITNSQIISLDDLNITISSNEINVFETENDWPKHMIPNYSNNLFNIVDEIWYIRKSNQTTDPTDYISKCKNSLSLYFDHIDYAIHHQTFIINSSKYLIIIGINVNSQYLAPLVMVYSKRTILSVSYDFSNWHPDNLGKIISEAIKNYENS